MTFHTPFFQVPPVNFCHLQNTLVELFFLFGVASIRQAELFYDVLRKQSQGICICMVVTFECLTMRFPVILTYALHTQTLDFLLRFY